MINLIICVLFFYAAHLFLKMTFSLHKVPFVNFTVRDGDLSGMTALSERMGDAGENLRQSLFIFIPFAVTSFLELSVSKVYITDIIQTYCMFNHEIITLLDDKTSNLSCVHRGKARTERKLN